VTKKLEETYRKGVKSMSREEVYRRLTNVSNDVFGGVDEDAHITLNDTTTADDIEDWDSFGHINLIMAIEDEFKMKFMPEEASSLSNVGEMVDIIMARMAQ
jgi:acyl carrier protein